MNKNQLRKFVTTLLSMYKKFWRIYFYFSYHLSSFWENMEFHVNPNEIPPVKDAESAYIDCEEL